MLTETGTFIINGNERVIISQLIKSPGVYFNIEYSPQGNNLAQATIIPKRGA